MTRRYTGGFISSTEQVTDVNSANGVFTLQEAGLYTAAGNFPTGGWVPARSLRFNKNSSNTLSRTPTVNGSRTTFTLSLWAKLSDLTTGADSFIWSSGTSGGNSPNLLW